MPSQPPSPPSEEQQSGAETPDNTIIIGIGASAGGLEAFSDLLTHLPSDTGLSFVFIQHLDPRHESLLTELLQQRTSMTVQKATSGVLPQPNSVYVIPPNTSMEIHNRALSLSSRINGANQMPIDLFFRSLAADVGAVAIGVVLSGSASDGTLGLKAIKGEGGITFAQDPSSAAFDGMPRSAIAAGCVDFVLSPSGIAQELVRISRHPYVSDPDMARVPREQERDFAEIFNILRAASNVDFSLYKHGTIRRRIYRRMALHKIETPAEYVKFLRERRSEGEALFQDLLINVTSFFREPATFEALRERVFPAITPNRNSEDPIRIWIPGCSTGEEVYSVAITLIEFLSASPRNVPVQIFGTDLSEQALEHTRSGMYPESISGDVSSERLRRFFAKVNGHYQISRNIRDMCIFARQNLTKDPPFSHLDILICRNLLIYLGPVLQKKVMKVFHYALKPSGFLVLGVSESVGSSGDLFTPIDRTLKIYSRKPVQSNIVADFEGYDVGARVPPAHRPSVESPLELQRRMDQMLLSRYTPAAVVVNRDLRIVQFRGQTSRYLEHATGAANLDLQRMARGGLGVEVRNLVLEVDKAKSPLESKTVSVPLEKNVEDVRISVSPMDGVRNEPQFLVVFEQPKDRPDTPKRLPPRKTGKKDAVPTDGRVTELEEELSVTRRYLQTVIEDQEAITEELKSANEEIQSSNEELQSTNEELLTAKEELQSTNEELTTVNEEMQNRNDELVRTNNDLVNLLASVNIPIVMLGNDLKIRRFTPQTERLLNLLPGDIGRSISDFKLKINVPDLEDLVGSVLEQLTAAEREVQDHEGRTYSMWIRPYRTADNKIDGAVLALFDVTDRKQATEARFRRSFECSSQGIIIVDRAAGTVLEANPSAARLLGRGRAELVGNPIFAIEGISRADIRPQTLADLHENETLRRETRFMRREGELVELEILADAYSEGERRLVQFNVRDLAPHRAAGDGKSEEIRRDLHNLEAASRIAASISRNFGNDLTAILMLCDLISQERLPPDTAEDVQKIREAANRAVALDKQLLAFGRRDTGRKELVNLNAVLADMKQIVGAVLGDHSAITSRTDPNLRGVEVAPAQIERIILNLFMNARRAGHDKPQIAVETANVTIDREFAEKHPAVQPGEYVSLSITDTSGQMRPEAAAASNPFRVDPAQYSGLSAVFETIREIGAQIWAFSELGVGSTVRVFFPPASAIQKEEPATAPETAEEATRGTETILVIEPDDAVRTATARGLSLNGYNVLESGSAAEARGIVDSHAKNIDLVIADVNHEQQNAPDQTKAVAEAAKAKIAFVSGETDAVLGKYGILNNPEFLLRKPYSAQQMAIFVRTVLEQA